MIIVRAPLRITLGGGGTDVASYYEEYGGFCLAAAIDRYVYITIHQTFIDDMLIKYSRMERVPSADKIQHPIIREVLMSLGIYRSSLEISSMADIPAGTGLGSSSSFTVALIKALRIHQHTNDYIHPSQLAERACYIEIDTLHAPIGKQDQYIAAYGGIRAINIDTDGSVEIIPVVISEATRLELEDNLLLFFTGYTRETPGVLSQQVGNVTDNLRELKSIAIQTQHALQAGDLVLFAELLSTQWELKKSRLPVSTNPDIDEYYDIGIANGASGGKLVGAGAGGFLLFYAQDRMRLRKAMYVAGLKEVRFRFDYGGTAIVISN